MIFKVIAAAGLSLFLVVVTAAAASTVIYGTAADLRIRCRNETTDFVTVEARFFAVAEGPNGLEVYPLTNRGSIPSEPAYGPSRGGFCVIDRAGMGQR